MVEQELLLSCSGGLHQVWVGLQELYSCLEGLRWVWLGLQQTSLSSGGQTLGLHLLLG